MADQTPPSRGWEPPSTEWILRQAELWFIGKAEMADNQLVSHLRGRLSQLAASHAEAQRQIIAAQDQAGDYQLLANEQEQRAIKAEAESPAPLDSDAAVIAAIRHELWQASNGRGFGEDRTLVAMVRRVIAERDEARDNRRGEFELRMAAEAELQQLRQQGGETT